MLSATHHVVDRCIDAKLIHLQADQQHKTPTLARRPLLPVAASVVCEHGKRWPKAHNQHTQLSIGAAKRSHVNRRDSRRQGWSRGHRTEQRRVDQQRHEFLIQNAYAMFA